MTTIPRQMQRSGAQRRARESTAARITGSSRAVSSLYIHVPFCVKKCNYCDFFSVSFDESTAFAYTDALCRELKMKAHLAGSLETVYIGGGTPSLLPHACLSRLFRTLQRSYTLSETAEVTIETNPGTISGATIDLLLSRGVNRISVGVQSFDDAELRLLGRIHTADDATRTLSFLRKSGFNTISLDLMFGIPGQTLDSWRTSLARCLECAPTHLSCYELTLEEGTPFWNSVQKPPEDAIVDMYVHACDFCEHYGYGQYEISNFALSGHRCVHNLNYWRRGEYIGAGAGAHSFVGDTRSRNVRDIRSYIRHLAEGVAPEVDSAMLSPVESAREFLFLGLRTTDGIRIRDADALGLDLLRAAEELREGGFLEMRGTVLRMTRRGFAVSTAVLVHLLQNLGL